jgi:predicted nucleotide-binding protein (sugar kinase/HSP70/actin superfamily)
MLIFDLGRKVHGRHLNLVAVEVSSFKCGPDAPIYSPVEQIVERSGTPYFSFKHLGELANPSSSVETIDYFLNPHRRTFSSCLRTWATASVGPKKARSRPASS